MNGPVYRSLAESFRLNIYLPESGLISPPASACLADEHLTEVMNGSRPPQSVLIDMIDGNMDIVDRAMRTIRGRAVPIVRFDSDEAGVRIAEYARENNIGDLTLCVPYEHRKTLARIRKLLPLSRGMLDMRGYTVPEFVDLVGQCHSNEATMLLMGAETDRELIRRLQKRFIQVWVEEDGNLSKAVLTGACGVVTQRTKEMYRLLKRFPKGSTQRPAPLYAHKTWHVTGEYPENSVKGCTAAGRLGYDAAEIDVQLTKDDVMVIQHDRHTKNLFTENKVVFKTEWAELKKLRRKAFPEDGLDTMDELMQAMKQYPETPVLIEIKTPADTFGVEEMVRQLKEMLPREAVQPACTLIMGVMPPYLSYVHEQMPYLPVAHCTYVKEDQATDSVDENNLRIYQFAMETRGANAGFNPYHPMIERTFARLAHVRGITVFPWTWAFEPWENCREAVTESFLQGHDGLTSDWVGKFYHVPVDVRMNEEGDIEALMRSRGWVGASENAELIDLGDGQYAAGVWTELEGGRRVCVLSRAYGKAHQ